MVFMAIIAFLLPIIVFVVSLAVFERAFTKIIDTKQLQMAISLLLAILSTLAVMLVAKVLNRQFEKNK
jgi:positive regulator of sigma E activity